MALQNSLPVPCLNHDMSVSGDGELGSNDGAIFASQVPDAWSLSETVDLCSFKILLTQQTGFDSNMYILCQHYMVFCFCWLKRNWVTY